MPQNETPILCRNCMFPATTITEYRTPDPYSAEDETFGPFYVLTCGSVACVDQAEDEAVYEGATEALIDVRLLSTGEAQAVTS